MTDFDHERVSRVVGMALAGPGGIGMVVKVFGGLPGVLVTPPRRGLFRSAPERIHIGEWRYEVTGDGRLSAAHFVNGIVIAEEVLPAGAIGPHVARSLAQVVAGYGPAVVPGIEAAVEMLETSGPGF